MRISDLMRSRYEEACTEPDSDIALHLPTLVNAALAIEAKRVIELGVRRGASTRAWLWAMYRTLGHLWSVDIDPAPNLLGPWTFVQGDDCTPSVLNRLPEHVDIVFIDTDHDYAHTLHELELYVPRVRHGGCVFLHDTSVAHPDDIAPQSPFPVQRAIEQFCADAGLDWTNTTESFGLGRIDIP